MSEHLMTLYLEHNRAYFRLSSAEHRPAGTAAAAAHEFIDNPDQRIVSDVDAFTKAALHFLVVFMGAGLRVFSFGAILYSISVRPRANRATVGAGMRGLLGASALRGSCNNRVCGAGCKPSFVLGPSSSAPPPLHRPLEGGGMPRAGGCSAQGSTSGVCGAVSSSPSVRELCSAWEASGVLLSFCALLPRALLGAGRVPCARGRLLLGADS